MAARAHIAEIGRLVGEGRIQDALTVSQAVLRSDPGAEGLVDLVLRLRADLLAMQSLEAVRSSQEHLKRLSATAAQQLVRDILRDPRYDDPRRLERFGAQVASQNEEDGMLAEVFRRIGTTNETFFEFGVGNGLQNNTLQFLFRGWRGAWVEINQPKLAFIRQRFADPIGRGALQVTGSPVTAENIDEVVRSLGLPEDLDLLSIDIDGNDYHVWKALGAIRPRVVIIEYNPRFPPPIRVVKQYDPDYRWSADTDIGASLQSLTDLATAKGYDLVGTCIGGLNAIYVRSDVAGDLFLKSATAADFFHHARFQISFSGGFGVGHPSTYVPFDTE